MVAKKKAVKKADKVEKAAKVAIPHYGVVTAAPLSETLFPKRGKGDRQECIDDLRQIAMDNPTMAISRNYYRVHGKYSESNWSAFFGTFLEFKRQSEVILSRPQHALERQIAKHASLDNYRQMNIDKADYGDKYLRHDSKRFQTILVASDMHDELCDRFYLRVLIDVAKRVQPEIINLGGDIYDAAEFSRYAVDPRSFNILPKIKFVHEQILEPLREAVPSAQIDWLAGNHECVEKSTEVLTDNGWVVAENITKEDKIASYTMDGLSIDYSPPIALKCIEGASLWGVSGDLSNELVSSNHRIDIDNELENVQSFSRVNQTRFRYAIQTEKESLNYTDNWLRLLTWVIMDGTVVSREYSLNYKRIQFKLSKERKIEQLRALLEEIDIPYTFRLAAMSSSNKLQPYYITIYGDSAREIASKLGDVKQIPFDFIELSRKQLDVVLSSIIDTDGTKSFNHINWRTTSKHDAEIIQLMCVTNGIACKIKEVNNASGFANGKLQYHVSIFHNGVHDRRYVNVKDSMTTGTVIAIQSTNGTLITRREGKISFTGNCRLIKHLTDATPAMKVLLSDLHGFTLGKLLGLDKYDVNFITKDDLSAYTVTNIKKEIAKNYSEYFNCFIVHHFPEGQSLGVPGVNGHNHKYISTPCYNATFSSYNWVQNGCGHIKDASYCNGSKWSNGFLLAHIDTHNKSVLHEYVSVNDEFAIAGGKFYYREASEYSRIKS